MDRSLLAWVSGFVALGLAAQPEDPPAAAGPLERVSGATLVVERDRESIRVLQGLHVLVRYRYQGAIHKPYLAAAALPGGKDVLADAPPDHLHHHGLMLACKAGDVDFWGEGPGTGRQVPLALEPLRVEARDGGESASIVQRLRWDDATGRALLDETRRIAVAPGDGKSVLVRWESVLTPAAGAGAVTLSGAPYHGFGARFAATLGPGRFLASTGGTGVSGTNGKRAEWCAYTGGPPGAVVTVALIDSPANRRHPTGWFSMDDPFSYLSATHAIGETPLVLQGGESLTLRLAMLLLAGPADRERIEREAARLRPRESARDVKEPQNGK